MSSSSSPAAAPDAPLPVGFRFRPTDEELVRHYLKPKIAGRAHPDLLLIPDVDLSACEPWELPARALIRSADPEWFFFAPLDRKYPGGHRSNRSTAAGYWKATGKDRLIRSPAGTLIGVKKTLVFHRGRAPKGHRTAWIMHEYRAAEPHLQNGQNGSFVLYRLFDKHEVEDQEASPAPATPAGTPSNSPNLEDINSPPNPQHVTPILKDEDLPVSSEMAHLLTTVTSNATTDAQGEDPLLDVLSQLPDLQPDQRFDGFPTVTSPMRPYTDHPFAGDVGGPDLSSCIASFLSHQDLQQYFLTPDGNAHPNPAALPMPINSSNSKIWPETAWEKSDSDSVLLTQVADGTGAACSSSPDRILQMDTNDVNHEAGTSLATMQQFTTRDLQQGTAPRRIRLAHSIQRASVTDPALAYHLENEGEAGSDYSVSSSSTDHNKDDTDITSQSTAGQAMHSQAGGSIPTQVVSLKEVTGKLQNFSVDEDKSRHVTLPHEANLKQRLKKEYTKTSQNVHEDPQHSNRVPEEPSLRRRQQPAPIGLVVKLFCLGLVVILVFAGLWKSSLLKSLH